VSRNGKQIERSQFASEQDAPSIKLASVKRENDTVEWKIVDDQGKITHSGILGFPSVGRLPKLSNTRPTQTNIQRNRVDVS
jgi:hypothetical protein